MNSSSVTAILQNLITNLQPFWSVIEWAAALTGFFFVAGGIVALVRVGREGGKAVKIASAGVVTGVLLLSLPSWMNTLSQTLFQQNAPGSLSMASSSGTGSYAVFVDFFLTIMMLWGLYSVIRSLVLFKESAEERGHIWSAITHGIAGIVAMNFNTLMGMLGLSLGGIFQSMIQHIF